MGNKQTISSHLFRVEVDTFEPALQKGDVIKADKIDVTEKALLNGIYLLNTTTGFIIRRIKTDVLPDIEISGLLGVYKVDKIVSRDIKIRLSL